MGGIVAGAYTVDDFRCHAEGMHPASYMASSYYEQWLYALEKCLLQSGAITAADIEERADAVAADPDAPRPRGENPELRAQMKELLALGVPEMAPEGKPRFAVGDETLTKVIRVTPGREHVRLPGYAQGKRGVVEVVHAPQALADAVVAGKGIQPEYVYTVRFRSSDLWPGARATDSVTVELWESYLEEES
jgi:nitrile hydratase